MGLPNPESDVEFQNRLKLEENWQIIQIPCDGQVNLHVSVIYQNCTFTNFSLYVSEIAFIAQLPCHCTKLSSAKWKFANLLKICYCYQLAVDITGIFFSANQTRPTSNVVRTGQVFQTTIHNFNLCFSLPLNLSSFSGKGHEGP